MGTFSHCHVTYFWMVKLRCLVPSRSQTRWMRNPPGCLPGKKYFVIHFLNNRAWPKNRPASLPPSFQSRKNIVPQAPIMPPRWQVTPKMAVIPAIIGQSEMVLVIITLCSFSPSDLIDLTWHFPSSFSKEKSLVCMRKLHLWMDAMPSFSMEIEMLSLDVPDSWSAWNRGSLPHLSVFVALC